MEQNSRSSFMPGIIAFALFLLLGVGVYFLYTTYLQDKVEESEQGDDNVTEVDNGDEDSEDEVSNDEGDEPITEASGTINLMATAQRYPELSVFVQMVIDNELTSTFIDEQNDYTLFIPNNAAFAATTLPADEMEAVINRHAVNETYTIEDLVEMNGETLESLGGDTLTITVEDGSVFINNIRILTADIEARNGRIHVLEGVIL
jgi:uncharacterized surface protein with fasciclin (FAS1) repeats